MERAIFESLSGWRCSAYRKPLYLRGISRTGKTWVLKEFGKRFYKNTVYISFREHEEYKQFFENTDNCDVNRILRNLILASGQKIVPEKTFLILDDIQECPQQVFTALEAFCEKLPQIHIGCAGIPLQKVQKTLPADKINVMELGPMTFTEVMKADAGEELADYLEQINTLEALPELWFQMLTERLKIYFITGGMPEAVYTWIKKRDVEALQEVLSRMVGSFEHSFAVHTEPKTFPKVLSIWRSVPLQLARENKKFFYKLVKEGARAREYEEALEWLSDTQYVKKIVRSHVPGVPVSVFDDLSAFRVYLPDVGILRRMSLIPTAAFMEGTRLFTESADALSENYVLNALAEQFPIMPRYWSQNNPFHEVDFLLQWKNEIIPAEVHAAAHKEGRGMKKYYEKFGDQLKLRVRFSLDNLNYSEGLLNIPLFLADYTEKLISITFQEKL